MTKDELLKKVIPHRNHWGTGGCEWDWGYGQIEISKILKMIEVGEKIGLSFTFAKKVTAMDDITMKERTITADQNYLFVFPSNYEDRAGFWEEVEKDG